jgi:hypothetical protein
MEPLEAAILGVVAGDIGCLHSVLTEDHSKLQVAAAKLGQLCVSRSAVANVVRAWHSGGSSAKDVQRWASFVRRGYVEGATVFPVRPLDIDYDPRDEDLIAEFIARLDEIGDLIDGHVDDDERKKMLQALQG